MTGKASVAVGMTASVVEGTSPTGPSRNATATVALSLAFLSAQVLEPGAVRWCIGQVLWAPVAHMQATELASAERAQNTAGSTTGVVAI